MKCASVIGAVVVAIGLAATPSPAAASPQIASIGRVLQDDILWIESTIEQLDADTIQIRIFAPTRNATKKILWQRCTFDYSGAGTYRCGLDVAAGSRAKRRSGTWSAQLLIDGIVVAAFRYSV